MTWTNQSMHFACILVILLCTACTGGHVSQDGSAVVGSNIEIRTCDSPVGTFVTATDGSGNFQFNPFDPLSPMIDSANSVPEGPVAILVSGADGSSVHRRDHQYTGTCPVAYNGSTQDVPCRIHSIDHDPMTLPDFLAEFIAFFEEDCGFPARTAEALSESITDPDYDPRIEADVYGLTGPGTRHASCVSSCTASCSGQSQADMMSCMCICVESSCGGQFGPFCTESNSTLP